jgi:nitrate reductase alpha subunit
MGSMKGHEYAFKHYLGTHHNSIAKDSTSTRKR